MVTPGFRRAKARRTAPVFGRCWPASLSACGMSRSTRFSRGISNSARQHAHHGARHAVDADGAAHRGGIRGQPALPESVGQQDGAGSAGTVLFAGEVAAQHGMDAQDVDEVRLDASAREPLGAFGIEVAIGGHGPGGHAVKGGALRSPLVVIGAEHELAGVEGGVEADGNQAVPTRVRKGTEQDSINDAEHRGAGADSDGDGGQRGEGETGGADESANRIAKIANEVVPERRIGS